MGPCGSDCYIFPLFFLTDFPQSSRDETNGRTKSRLTTTQSLSSAVQIRNSDYDSTQAQRLFGAATLLLFDILMISCNSMMMNRICISHNNNH